MTPDEMAAIHAAAMTTSAPWSEAAFRETLGDSSVFSVVSMNGFAVGRVVLDEAELLTIAVEPHAQRTGMGRTLLAAFETEARARGATAAFLEVAADNPPALVLYQIGGWRAVGRRKGYYPRGDSPAADALTLRKSL